MWPQRADGMFHRAKLSGDAGDTDPAGWHGVDVQSAGGGLVRRKNLHDSRPVLRRGHERHCFAGRGEHDRFQQPGIDRGMVRVGKDRFQDGDHSVPPAGTGVPAGRDAYRLATITPGSRASRIDDASVSSGRTGSRCLGGDIRSLGCLGSGIYVAGAGLWEGLVRR